MMDLHDHLAGLAGPTVPPSSTQADADLDRARRALRRRRALQKAAGSAFAVAAIAAAVAYGTSAHPGAGTGTPPVAGGITATTTTGKAAPATKLVSYQGEQPKGFTVDFVPDGWEIQGGSAGSLTIAPVGAPNQDPDVFKDKIGIMLQSKDDHSVPKGTKVKVGDRTAVLNKGLGTDHGQNLWLQQPDGVWMIVQIWDATGWTQDSIATFAAGIHVLPGAVRGVG